MKMVVAIVQQHKLEALREALVSIGVKGMTATEVKGFGRQKGSTQVYRAAEVHVDFLQKTKLEVAVADKQLDSVVQTIIDTAKTGNIGDGKIFVYDIEQIVRIRTNEKGEEAL